MQPIPDSTDGGSYCKDVFHTVGYDADDKIGSPCFLLLAPPQLVWCQVCNLAQYRGRSAAVDIAPDLALFHRR